VKTVPPIEYRRVSLRKIMYRKNRIKMVAGNLEECFTVFQFL